MWQCPPTPETRTRTARFLLRRPRTAAPTIHSPPYGFCVVRDMGYTRRIVVTSIFANVPTKVASPAFFEVSPLQAFKLRSTKNYANPAPTVSENVTQKVTSGWPVTHSGRQSSGPFSIGELNNSWQLIEENGWDI